MRHVLVLLVAALFALASAAQGALDCSNAQSLECTGFVAGSTVGLPNNVTNYGCVAWNELGGEQVWLITLIAPRVVSFAVDAQIECDLDIFLLSACDPAACVAYGGRAFNKLLLPGTYYLVVDGYGIYAPACEYTLTTACSEPVTIGWCNLQWPVTLATTVGGASELVYGQAWIDGLTNQPGATPGLTAELGYGPDGSDPSADPSAWHWTPAVFNFDVGNNDEFMAQVTASASGTYDYCYRYSYGGGSWIYGDLDGSWNGYSPAQAGSLVVTTASAVPASASTALRLHSNQPNPFNPRTTIKYDLPEAGSVRLSVFDVAGRLIRTLVNDSMPQGSHEAVWDGLDASGREVGSGSYLARLEFGGKVEVVRMGLVR